MKHDAYSAFRHWLREGSQHREEAPAFVLSTAIDGSSCAAVWVEAEGAALLAGTVLSQAGEVFVRFDGTRPAACVLWHSAPVGTNACRAVVKDAELLSGALAGLHQGGGARPTRTGHRRSVGVCLRVVRIVNLTAGSKKGLKGPL